jgi:hypothetical protein
MSVRIGSTLIAGTVEVDSTITQGSANPVAGGTLYTALDGKQNSLSQGTNITINNDVISTTAAKVIIRRFS